MPGMLYLFLALVKICKYFDKIKENYIFKELKEIKESMKILEIKEIMDIMEIKEINETKEINENKENKDIKKCLLLNSFSYYESEEFMTSSCTQAHQSTYIPFIINGQPPIQTYRS